MNILSKVVIVLIFVLAGTSFIHNITSINADIGRHIGLGEIIWRLKEVPKTNLLSFTAPDFPFINHHWLSEVIFYKIYSLGGNWLDGLRSVIVFKAIVLLTAFFLLFLIVRKRNIFAVTLAFIISVFVFAARTEPRPEIFSYLIFAAYLSIIYKAREAPTATFRPNWLWLLPVLQLFWVNLHIYFALGPIIFLFFLLGKEISRGGWKFWKRSRFGVSGPEFGIFVLIILVNLINPNFIAGALYPFTVLNHYGYSVAENSSLFFLAKHFGQWAPQDKLFLAALFVLIGSFFLWFWKNKLAGAKTRIFDLLLVSMLVALSFKMQRNIPLFALSLWPVMSENINFIFETKYVKKFFRLFYAGAIFILALGIYFTAGGRFYNYLDSAKIFGLGVSSAAQAGTDFVKANKIQGPVFNNFNIGSYLAWQLYPEQKVFIDGRPEAYPAGFFDGIYKPMQRDEKVWREMSERYGINYVFFAHTDATEWGYEFLERISGDEKWPMVFLNDAVVVFLKDTAVNRPIIDKYEITDRNLDEKIAQILKRLDKKDDNAFINFGNALFRFGWFDSSAKVFEALIANQPRNPYGYQGAGYAYASMNNPATQERAAENLKKAVALGFKTFNNYFTLGVVCANLGDFPAAEDNITKALKINPDNQNARQALEIVQGKLRTNDR